MEAVEERSYCPTCNAVFRTPFARCPLDGSVLATCEGDPLVGTTLDKRYQIEECIGEGGMGRVYRAKHVRMSRQYAIKILFGDHAGNTRMRSRFAREAEAVSRLSHGNIISIVDFGETEEGLLYLVMDLADGESLAELVYQDAPFTQIRAMAIIGQLLKGLAHAHKHGLVHRDFKCENVIMVSEEGNEVPKIVDFGICMIVEEHPSATMLTSSGMILGTPAVMAPEQASGDQVDHRTDLFSLGIVGFQMLSGLLPFDGTPMDMARKNLYETIPTIQERSGIEVSPQIQAIISKLTAKNPDDRFQSAEEALEHIASLEDGHWITLTPTPVAQPGRIPTPAPAPNPEMQFAHTASLEAPTTQLQYLDSAIPQTFGSAAMNTEIVHGLGQSPIHVANVNRKKMVWGISGALLLGALFLIIALSGGDSEPSQSGLLAANSQDAGHLQPNDTVEPNKVVPNKPVEKTTPETIPESPKSTAISDEKVATPKVEDKQSQTKPLAHKKGNPKNKKTKIRPKHKDRPKQTLSAEEVLQKKIAANLKLHSRVGNLLSKVRKKQGKAAVKDITSAYGAISRTQLGRNPNVQAEYSATLKRLLRELKSTNR